MSRVWQWVVLFSLGAYHGINPAMGWLFAVALGLQEKSRRAVFRAIPPIALGHGLSIGIIVSVLWLARTNLPERPLRYGAAAILFGFASYRMIRSRHPTWVGMRVGGWDLILWSFLMASAHGAGLMLLPVLLASPRGGDFDSDAAHISHGGHWSLIPPLASGGPVPSLAAAGVHTIGYLVVATIVALLVYEKLGVAILRRAWLNLDLVWMIALMISGVLIVIV